MDDNETIQSLTMYTVKLLLTSDIPCEMRAIIVDKVIGTFCHDGYISLDTVLNIVYQYELIVNPKAMPKNGPYDDLFGWARI